MWDAGWPFGCTGCGGMVVSIHLVVGVRFVRGTALRNQKWREVERRGFDWASRSLRRVEFELLIMVEVLIGEMVGSD